MPALKKQTRRGRPSIYSRALTDKICTRLAGGESLRSICRDSDMPTLSTVLLWVVDGKHEEFSEQYMRAREAAGYAHADRITETVELLSSESVKPEVARVMMDGLKWAAERMAPKNHSPRQQTEHSGNVGYTIKTAVPRDPGEDA